jgi:pyruvate dehydrogenase E1 component
MTCRPCWKDKRPTVFIAYTVKGFGLPLQGHKDNHAGLMTETQMAAFRTANGVREGHEWDKFEGAGLPAAQIEAFLKQVPFAQDTKRKLDAPAVAIPAALPQPKTESLMSTQQA